jgi:hypothetical protein
LAENAGLNIISPLYASHEKGNIKDGVDIEVSVVVVVVWIGMHLETHHQSTEQSERRN